jgi:SAM-dependent methyltransferase
MSTNLENLVKKRVTCSVCGSDSLIALVELSKLPLTGLFIDQKPTEILKGYDQRLLFCGECGHGQLGNILTPDLIYDESYGFRTSSSNTARKGTAFFIRCLDELIPHRQFQGILDLGCNDLYLLDQIKQRSRARIGIDPVWRGKEAECPDQEIKVLGATIEEIDPAELTRTPVDLVLCRHTLEHIDEPRTVLEKLVSISSEDALFLFEVPGFEALVARYRFDQVFHQHLQYFSLSSFRRLITELNLHYRGSWSNYHDWGAMIVAFSKRPGGEDRHLPALKPDFDYIRRQYGIFEKQMALTGDMLSSPGNQPLYGYGAAQMLPVLAYHLKSDLSMLQAILDDDPGKNNWYYQNLPLLIQNPAIVQDFSTVSVLVTAFDNAAPILNKLLNNRPKHLILPFPVM